MVEKLLGPAVEDISIAPAVVKIISEGSIDQSWVNALDDLEKRSKVLESKMKESETIFAIADVKPVLDDLTNKVMSDLMVLLDWSLICIQGD